MTVHNVFLDTSVTLAKSSEDTIGRSVSVYVFY